MSARVEAGGGCEERKAHRPAPSYRALHRNMAEDLYEAAEKKDWREFGELAEKVDKPDAFTVRGAAARPRRVASTD